MNPKYKGNDAKESRDACASVTTVRKKDNKEANGALTTKAEKNVLMTTLRLQIWVLCEPLLRFEPPCGFFWPGPASCQVPAPFLKILETRTGNSAFLGVGLQGSLREISLNFDARACRKQA